MTGFKDGVSIRGLRVTCRTNLFTHVCSRDPEGLQVPNVLSGSILSAFVQQRFEAPILVPGLEYNGD